jgi:hypothetical protein
VRGWAVTFYRPSVPLPDRVEIVRFTGGELSGLVVEAPSELAERLPGMKLTVTAAGQLYDLVGQCRLREARVIARPGEQPPAPPARPTPPAPVKKPAKAEPALTLAPPETAPQPATARRPAPGVPLFRPARPAQ